MTKEIITVISTLNSKYIHSSLAPWCLLAGVKMYCSSNIQAVVVEGTINEEIYAVAKRIIEKKPQIIGFSCYIWNIINTKILIELIKKELPNTIIVLGGPEVSYNAESVLQNKSVDYVISGEGEKPFAFLLNAIAEEKCIPPNMGICYKVNDCVKTAKPYIPLEQPPSPYTAEYFNALKGRIAYLETSRGCPYNCAFCLSGRCGSARFFDTEKAKKELLLLAKSGSKTIKLVDRTFNANKERAIELFEFIINNYEREIPKSVCFHFEIAGDILDDKTIKLLSTAPIGAIQLEIGLQTFNEKTLKYINRKTNIERLVANIAKLIANNNMHIHIDLIAGLPYENIKSFEDSFNTAYALKPHMLQLGFLKLLHGAPMREEPKKFPCTYSSIPPYEIITTPWLSEPDIAVLHKLEDALDRINNSGRFRRTIDYLLKATNLTPFTLLKSFGEYEYSNCTDKISLDDYTEQMFNYFASLNGVDKAVLRDTMVCDRLSTNASGLLPPVLRIKDSVQKKIRLELENTEKTKGIHGKKRGLAILYTQNTAVYADYINKNPINGEYELKYYKYNS